MRAELAPPMSVAALLDSFAIGGVYTVLPRGGYGGGSWYARSPEKERYAGTVSGHPTGLELPVGLPVRILAAGSYTSHATAEFQRDYCALAGHASDPRCSAELFTYTIHGLADGPGVARAYEPGMGLALTWSRTAGYYERFYGVFPTAEFYRGLVPAADTATVRELHFRRAGCCYYFPSADTAVWETYEGSWRFGAVPDDGGQAELGVPAVLRLLGPRTDSAMTAPATFSVTTTTSEPIGATRWWYVRAANNVFDGEPVPLVTITQPWTMQIPRYPVGKRAVFEELVACAGQPTCTYQASAAGAVVVQATLTETRVLAARNTGATGAHVKITADETTLTYGDTTVFRVTAPGAPDGSWWVTGLSFSPLASPHGSSLRAVHENATFRATKSASAVRRYPSSNTLSSGRPPTGGDTERVVPARSLQPVPFRDAAYSCGDSAIRLCYDDPRVTGYEIVTALVGGAIQRDSILITVLPKLMLTCKNSNGETDSNGGTTVVRAQSVSCRAALAPEGSTQRITVSDWTFVSHDRWIVRKRSDVDPTFSNDSLAWTGRMVATGVVTVFAAVSGSQSDSASARITVHPRRWNGDSIPRFPPRPTVVGQGWLVDRPRLPGDLGQVRWRWRENDVVDSAAFHELISEGPNAFVYYLKAMPPVLDSIRVAYNQVALARNSAFHLLQEPDNPARIFSAANPCFRSDVISAETKDKILAHEGTNWELNPPSHAGLMRKLTLALVPAAAESVFVQVESGGRQGLMNRWQQLVYDSVEAKIDTIAGEALHSVSRVQFGSGSRVGCSFAYFAR
ncbi:MAG: hypothetical protein HYV19_10445 [Gemmatimonadetes bacterium]|nr:hypothetical protein [Gemmatimonadota bacterium]